MKILKNVNRFLAIVLASILGLLILTIGGLNIAKFKIYREYYEAKTALCKNPGLNDGFVCQGIAAVDGDNRILISGYMTEGRASRIYVTTTDGESYYVTLNCDGAPYMGHAGGIAVSGDKAYIAGGSRIYSFELDDVLNASNTASVNIGKGTKVNNKASFLYTDDEYLYVGSFTEPDDYYVQQQVYAGANLAAGTGLPIGTLFYGTNTEYVVTNSSAEIELPETLFETAEGLHLAICSVYPIDDLSAPVKVYSIRDYVQGICFTPDGKIVLSTSYGLTSSGYYVYDRDSATDSGKTLDGAPVYILEKPIMEFSGPAMAEGMDYYNGGIITLTESASNKYIFGKLFFADDIVHLNLDSLLP